MLGQRATAIIVALVSTVWAINFIAGLIMTSYDADQMINTIFMAIVGGTIALGRKGRNGGDGEDKK